MHDDFIDCKKNQSPYIKKFKNSKIKWHRWDKEVFNKANKENKLVFLFIGSFDCPSCDRMLEAYFKDMNIMDTLKNDYIPVFVDKDEREDLVKLYTIFTEFLITKKKWPLNIILTPESIPVYIGNYFDMDEKDFIREFNDALIINRNNWIYNREDLIKNSHYALREVKNINNISNKGNLDSNIFSITKNEMDKLYNWEHGAFVDKPNIPLPQNILFLLRYYDAFLDEDYLKMAENTLINMYKGPVYDHISGGFFRYAEDSTWNKPRLEKTLIGNILLATSYVKAYESTSNNAYKEIAMSIFQFIVRDLFDENLFINGILFKDEYYNVLEDETLSKILGEESSKTYNDFYNLSEGNNLPKLSDFDFTSEKYEHISLENEKLYKILKMKNEIILDKRKELSYNALAIGALAYAYLQLNELELLNKAIDISRFIIDNMILDDYSIHSKYIHNQFFGEATLEDYAALIYGFIGLYTVTDDNEYLKLAIDLNKKTFELFWNKEDKFIYYNKVNKNFILNIKDNVDTNIPSSTALMAYNLIRLYNIVGDDDYYIKYRTLVNNYSGDIVESPTKYIYTILTLFFL